MSTFLYGAHVHANRHSPTLPALRRPRPGALLIPASPAPAITWGFVAERLGEYDVYVCSCAAAFVVQRPGTGL